MEENIQATDTDPVNINADSDVPGNTHMNQPDGAEATEKLLAELDEQKEKYLRLFAEFENFKKRTRHERDEFAKIANRDVIASLLEVLDDCDRAEKQMNASDDITQLKEGVSLIFNKLRSKLQSKGLKAMESVQTDFDVEKHEAITEIPGTDEQKGKVVDEVEKGYYLHDKIIRFAKVVVGK